MLSARDPLRGWIRMLFKQARSTRFLLMGVYYGWTYSKVLWVVSSIVLWKERFRQLRTSLQDLMKNAPDQAFDGLLHRSAGVPEAALNNVDISCAPLMQELMCSHVSGQNFDQGRFASACFARYPVYAILLGEPGL